MRFGADQIDAAIEAVGAQGTNGRCRSLASADDHHTICVFRDLRFGRNVIQRRCSTRLIGVDKDVVAIDADGKCPQVFGDG